MGYKYNDKKGCWEAWHSLKDSKSGKFFGTRRTNIKSQIAAKKIEREIILQLHDTKNEDTLPTWEAQIEAYLKHCERNGQAKKSIYNADKCLKAATLPLWKGLLIDTITTEAIRDLIQVKFGSKSESYKKALLKFIRLAFEVAVESGVIQRNPAPKMKFKIGKKLKTVLTVEQVKILLNKAKSFEWEWYPHVLIALYTGMRSGELYALTWDKIDFEVGLIKVNRAWNNKDGFKPTKNNNDRVLDMAPELKLFLQQLKLKSDISEFVLPRIGRWDKGEQARELRMFLKAIGIPEVRFHDLRATWATMMLSRGVEPVKVMKMGGWAHMDTMMRYIREAGIDIRGIAGVLKIHNPVEHSGIVKNLSAYFA